MTPPAVTGTPLHALVTGRPAAAALVHRDLTRPPAPTAPPRPGPARAGARGLPPNGAGAERTIGLPVSSPRGHPPRRFTPPPASSAGPPGAVIDWPAVIA